MSNKAKYISIKNHTYFIIDTNLHTSIIISILIQNNNDAKF